MRFQTRTGEWPGEFHDPFKCSFSCEGDKTEEPGSSPEEVPRSARDARAGQGHVNCRPFVLWLQKWNYGHRRRASHGAFVLSALLMAACNCPCRLTKTLCSKANRRLRSCHQTPAQSTKHTPKVPGSTNPCSIRTSWSPPWRQHRRVDT